MRNVVVLPAPFGPSRPNTSPRCTENDVCATAVNAPNFFTRSSTSIRAGAALAGGGKGSVSAAPCAAVSTSAGGAAPSASASLRSFMKPSSRRGSAGLA